MTPEDVSHLLHAVGEISETNKAILKAINRLTVSIDGQEPLTRSDLESAKEDVIRELRPEC